MTLICKKDFNACRTPGMCAPHGGCKELNRFVGQDQQKNMDELVAAGIQVDKDLIAQLKAENELLRKVATELRNWVGCENVHHNKCERHEWDDPCTVLARIDKALSKEG